MVSINILQYGCTANYDNGNILAGLLIENNHSIVNNTEEADVVIVNSCTVKGKTADKIHHKIRELIEEGKKLVVTGCMPAADNKLLKEIAPKAALISTQNITEINNVISKLLEGENLILTNKRKEIKLGLPKLNPDNKIASLQISEGCASHCGFCSTKLAKGNLYSYPKEKIVEEMKKYVEQGYKRINLTSTDNGCYGIDLGYNLVDLLKDVIEIDGKFEVRVGMANPEHVKKYYKELADIYKNEKIMKFIHIPVQAGSDKILEEMNRKYTVEEYKRIVEEFRKQIPGITIATDIIVGYPTEDDSDFVKTVELVKELKFEVINISKFASRPRTKANKLKQLTSEVIKERSVELTKVYLETKENKEIEEELIEIDILE